MLRDLERMSGSPALARTVKKSLDQLAHGAAGAELAEMARDVLAGRTDLRTAARVPAYTEPLTTALDGFRHWYDSLSPQERDQVIAEARAQLDVAEQDDAEQ